MDRILPTILVLALVIPAWVQPSLAQVSMGSRDPDPEQAQAAITQGREVAYVFAKLDTLLAGRTIAEFVWSGEYTGPVPAIRSLLGRMPIIGQGPTIADTIRQEIPRVVARFFTALAQDTPFAGMDAFNSKRLGLEPMLWDNPGAMLGRIVGVRWFLLTLVSDLDAIVDLRQTRADRRADQISRRLLRAMLDRLSPDVISEPDTNKRRKLLEEFVKNNPPGTPVIYLESNKWVLRYTTKPGAN